MNPILGELELRCSGMHELEVTTVWAKHEQASLKQRRCGETRAGDLEAAMTSKARAGELEVTTEQEKLKQTSSMQRRRGRGWSRRPRGGDDASEAGAGELEAAMVQATSRRRQCGRSRSRDRASSSGGHQWGQAEVALGGGVGGRRVGGG